MPNLIHNIGAFSAAVFPALSASAVVESATVNSLVSPINLWSSLTADPFFMGAAWMVSSAIFTTYSTTKFIKYPSSTPVSSTNDKRKIPHWNRVASGNHRRHSMPSSQMDSSHSSQIFRSPSMSPSSRLTLYRFAGSLFLGLLFPLNGLMHQRWSETVTAIPQFLLPAVCLFVANFANA
jgi:hypothetical protein